MAPQASRPLLFHPISDGRVFLNIILLGIEDGMVHTKGCGVGTVVGTSLAIGEAHSCNAPTSLFFHSIDVLYQMHIS